MEMPQFTVADIQLSVGDHEFNKALALHTKGAVSAISKTPHGFYATVSGTHEYSVSVGMSSFDSGYCDCHIGQKNELCKHMLALAIAVVYKHRPGDIKPISQPLDQAVCLGEVRAITDNELATLKEKIRVGISYIRSYNGPSAKWFQYQDSLTRGSRLILLALADIPVCKESARVCINTVQRLDKKILRGVDDSDGTVGDLMCQIIEVLNLFVSFDSTLKDFVIKKLPKGESFDWERGFKL